MSRKFMMFDVGQKATEYIAEWVVLGRGVFARELSRKLIKGDRYRILSLVPEDTPEEVIYDFDAFRVCGADESVEFLAKYIHEKYRDNDLTIFIFEEFLATPEGMLKRERPFESKYFIYDGVVYHYAFSPDYHDLETALYEVDGYPRIGVLTKTDSRIKEKIKKNEVDVEEVRYLRNKVFKGIIGAYDRESFLLIDFES